jgi:hypothetical protein
MPTILDLFKKASGDKDVTIWNGGHKNKGLGGKIMDFVKAEANPKGPRVLFYKKLVTPPLIYGTETPRISLKGTVDPARSLATRGAVYNAKVDGNKPPKLSLGALLGGSANRPSDTIFESKTGAPVTKGTLPSSVGDHSALQNAVVAGEEYFISEFPSGPNALSGILKGDLNQIGAKVVGAATAAAKKAIGKAVTKVLTSKRKKNQREPQKPKDSLGNAGKLYKGGKNSGNGNVKDGHVKNSEYFTTYDKIINPITGNEEYIAVKAEKREGFISLDSFNRELLLSGYYKNDSDLDASLKNNATLGATYVKIKPYGKNYTLVFPGAVTGISEDISPEWSSFRYIGSPFKVHRYQGVERSLKFNLKLYYLSEEEKYSMIMNLNSLKEMAFPYNEISEMTYGNDKQASQYAFSPNFINLSIGGLYKNVFGFVDNLSFSIDDNVSWASIDPNFSTKDEYLAQAYPTVIDVNFSMKIIETPSVVDSKKSPGVKVYKYNFDGLDYSTTSQFEDEN